MGAWAAAAKPRGGVLVIHENRGLNDSVRAIAGRLAGSGYSALAIDLLSAEGGTGSFEDEFDAMSALGAIVALRWLPARAHDETTVLIDATVLEDDGRLDAEPVPVG